MIQKKYTHLNYFEGPDNGQAILLVHGSSSRWQAFYPILPELMTQFHVYALDLRGHGESGRTSGAYQLQDYLADIHLFLREIIKKPAVILGHSMGGMIAIMLAALHPELVRALIIAEAPMTLDRLRNLVNSQRDFAHKIIAYLKAANTEAIYADIKDGFMAESLSLCDPDALTAIFDCFEATFNVYQVNNLLPKIHCPVLILRGDNAQKSLIGDFDLQNTVKLLPQLKQVIISNASHALFSENRLAVMNAIKLFLDEVIGSATI